MTCPQYKEISTIKCPVFMINESEVEQKEEKWDDILIKLDNNILVIYFNGDVEKEKIEEKKLTDRVTAAFINNKIVSISIHDASMNLACHLYDSEETIENKLPLNILCDYDIHVDSLMIYLVDFIVCHEGPIVSELSEDPYLYDIIYDIDDNRMICNIEILSASKNIFRGL